MHVPETQASVSLAGQPDLHKWLHKSWIWVHMEHKWSWFPNICGATDEVTSVGSLISWPLLHWRTQRVDVFDKLSDRCFSRSRPPCQANITLGLSERSYTVCYYAQASLCCSSIFLLENWPRFLDGALQLLRWGFPKPSNSPIYSRDVIHAPNTPL